MFKKILSLVLTVAMLLTVATFPSLAASTGTIVTYPEYPDIIERDYDYSVEVSNGVETYEIPVYNASRKYDSFDGTKNTDSWRRFCEFSFEGEVTVTVTTKLPMTKAAVLPSSKGIDFTVSDNKISFKLYNPENVVVRLNDDNNTILSIFAEALEEEFVSETTNVLYFEAGLNNFNRQKSTIDLPVQNSNDGYGSIRVQGDTTIYLAPGAVLTLRIYARGDDTHFVGRGAILDPHTQRGGIYTLIQVQHQQIYNEVVERIKFDGIKLLDPNTFAITLLDVDGVDINNVKILASEISTDGISTYGQNITVNNSFIYTSDDTFVIGRNTDLTVKDSFVGSSGSFTHVHTHNSYGKVLFEDVDIFRMGDFFRNVEKNTNATPVSDYEITLKNINAVDALTSGAFIRSQVQGSDGENGGKHIYFENVSLPAGRNIIFSADSGSINVTANGVYIGGTLLTSTNQLAPVNGYSFSAHLARFKFTFGTGDATALVMSQNSKTVSYGGAPYVTVGGYQIPYDKGVVTTINGEKYAPVKNLLENLDYQVEINGDTIVLTNEKGVIKVNNNIVNYYGVNFSLVKPAVVENDCAYLPVSFLNEYLGITANVNGENVEIAANYNGENLLKEGRFENLNNLLYNNTNDGYPVLIDSHDWTHFNQSPIYISTDAHSGNTSVSVATYDQENVGIAQYLGSAIKKYGAGTYRFEAWVKKGSSSITGREETFNGTLLNFGIVQASYRLRIDGELIGINDITQVTLTDSWQKITYDVVITDPNTDGYDRAFFYLGNAEATSTNIILDDASVTFTKTVNNTSELSALLNSPAPTRQGEIFKGWVDKNGNLLTTSSNVSSSTAVYPEFLYLGEEMNGKVENLPVVNVGGVDHTLDECRLGIHYNVNGNGVEYNVIDSEGDMGVQANQNLKDGMIVVPKADTYYSQVRYWDGTTNHNGGAWLKAFTSYEAPDNYTPKTVKLNYNANDKVFSLPAEVIVYVGDTLIFDTGKPNNDPNPVPQSANYINGMYLQGVQARVGGNNLTTGLRFITVNNVGFIETLKSNFTEVDFGTIVIAQKDFNSSLLVKDTSKSKDVLGQKIYHTARGLDRWYQKYTACVTGIPTTHLKSNVVARPYVKYTDNSGVVRYIYGEQYATNIYDVAVAAYNSPYEDAKTKNYLFNEIIKKLGVDNDSEIEF